MLQLDLFAAPHLGKEQEGATSLQNLPLMLKWEQALWSSGFNAIAGVDEAGRGPLAGPVVAAACIFPKGMILSDVQDSKKLTADERQRLYDILTSDPAITWSIGIVQAELIDKLNILQATLFAMKKAIEALPKPCDFVLVDGRDCPPVGIPKKAVVKGDSRSQSIAAASIIAKVTRDALMDDLHRLFPEYGFNKHKGYGTKDHLKAIDKHGPLPIHRKSFAPFKKSQVQIQEYTLFD